MAKPGRKPTPTALKILTNNPGKRPLPENEPQLEAEAPHAPRTLSEPAKKHWRVIVKQLAAAKVMTRMDSDALALYCETYARWVEANTDIQTRGIFYDHIIETKHTDGSVTTKTIPKLNHYLSISNKAFEQMKAMLTEFGMTPASRTRVQTVGGKDKKKDPWSAI